MRIRRIEPNLLRPSARRLTALALAAILASACGGGTDDDPETGGDTSSTTSTTVAEPTTTVATTTSVTTTTTPEVDLADTARARLLESLGDDAGGVAVLWRTGGETIRVAVGTADDSGSELQPDQALRVGSISKPFVATMVMQLVDEGRISLDDPVATHLPAAAPDGAVTVRQLLSHQSGVPSYTDQQPFLVDTISDPGRAFTPDELLAYIDGVEAGATDVFAYSNTNYVLLGMLVEAVDGTTLNESLGRRITDPLGLSTTVFATADEPHPFDLAGGWSAFAGYEGDPGEEYTALASSAWAAGSLVSTTDDLAAFLDGLFDGTLVSAEALEQMTDVGGGLYGLGLFTARLDPLVPAYGHNGLIPGFSSTMAFEPGTGNLVVVLTNNELVNADVVASDLITALG